MLNYSILFTTIIVGLTEAGILETIPLQQQSEQLIGLRKVYYENRPIIGYEAEILKPDLRPLAEPLRVINQARLLNPSGSIQFVQSSFEPQQRYRLQQQDNLDRSSSATAAATAIASSQGATAYGNAIQRYSSEIPQYASSAASAASASSVALSRSDNTAQDLYNVRDGRLQQLINDDYTISANQYVGYSNNNNGLQNN